MLDFQRALLGGMMIATIGIASYPVSASPVPTTPVLAQQPSPPRSRMPDISTETAIDTFISTFNRRRTRSPGLSRSGGFCPISPGLVETDTIWSDRPLFIWQGAVEQIQLRVLGGQDILWRQTLNPQQHSVVYSGPALLPGQIYQWELLGQSNANVSFVFQVMELDQRVPIAAQIQEIEAEASADRASKEGIAMEQAQYFANQNLWSDALQVLYSIDPPSPKITQAIQQIEVSLCSGRAQSQ
ncbi:DUF928 domain-containing protein [Phormidium tenue FACHB-886]|nr:DUF928 domain-containing protein [Phormidium tenue FACHB-886]